MQESNWNLVQIKDFVPGPKQDLQHQDQVSFILPDHFFFSLSCYKWRWWHISGICKLFVSMTMFRGEWNELFPIIKCLFFSCLLGNLTWVIFRPIFFSYEKQGMIFQNFLSQGSFAVVIWFVTVEICSSLICRGVNLVAFLNWKMPEWKEYVVHLYYLY